MRLDQVVGDGVHDAAKCPEVLGVGDVDEMVADTLHVRGCGADQEVLALVGERAHDPASVVVGLRERCTSPAFSIRVTV